MGVATRLQSQLNRYPPEALESLCHSVRGDELDARRAAALLPPRPNPASGLAPTGCFVVGCRCMRCAAKCRVPCVRRRHAMGALHFFYNCVRNKPVVPWAPEAARRVLSAMLAAVRALCVVVCTVRRQGSRLLANPPHLLAYA